MNTAYLFNRDGSLIKTVENMEYFPDVILYGENCYKQDDDFTENYREVSYITMSPPRESGWKS
jgi:hypothetical protein